MIHLPARVPVGVVELLRLCVVVFFAGIGYQITTELGSSPTGAILGPFNALWLSIIVGSGLGYVIGGVLGRSTVGAVSRTERALRATPAEQIVAGVIGGVLGVVVGVGVAWPVLLFEKLWLTIPIFGFIVVTLGMLGYRIGASKHRSIIALFGSHAGLSVPVTPTSTLPRVIDTSVAIDGRILDVVRAGFLHGVMLLPNPVIAELQGLADAGDDTRRAKGRRGLEVLESLRREAGIEVQVLDAEIPAVPEVDAKLVRICLDQQVALLTLDTNLAKAAALAGVRVLNLHALAVALRPPVGAGDSVTVALLKVGKEPGQAIGYLDDGTMVVVEHSRDAIGSELTVHVTSVLVTANGRMVFARLAATTAGVPTAEVATAGVGGHR
jgi:uncharacterized protein YacL